jgi:DNA invertase Pin-like site-specific DNA recombinase
MRIAAIYARVSSEQQREANTIASQTSSLIEFAQGHDLEVPKEWVFEDDGYSGATLERPGLERVRDLAAAGQIQVVLAYAPDRLSRKYAYQILLIEELARHGVETLFIKAPQGSSAEDQLLVQFQGMIAEYERAQILERSRRGKRHRAQSGEVRRRAPWLDRGKESFSDSAYGKSPPFPFLRDARRLDYCQFVREPGQSRSTSDKPTTRRERLVSHLDGVHF